MTDDEDGTIYFLPIDVRPYTCLMCGEDMIRPLGWKLVEIDGIYVISACGSCHSEYMVVMSTQQADIWDLHMRRQYASMEDSIKHLAVE